MWDTIRINKGDRPSPAGGWKMGLSTAGVKESFAELGTLSL